ncbi:unnamed protein product [Cylindrotheca closterium]|uniref:Uncharacterized protein n=1 Tax=Cylindrotheca closterium TaxID=2856 RepID=A0AAD2G3N3_9STRA|nr:unnamed protein product [Cylindrotheca closterium]
MTVSTSTIKKKKKMMSSLSTFLCLAAAASLPNASASVDLELNQQMNSQEQRRMQQKVNSEFVGGQVPSRVDFGDDLGETSSNSLAANNADDAFNYRSCGSGITQAGFATLQFLYDIETNVTMTPSSYLTVRQQTLQEQQLKFLKSTVFPETMSTALLERLQEKACGVTFYQPVLEVISISSGKDDEVWGSCNQTMVESRSCTRYLGSLLIGVNNTAILGSVDTKVGKHILPALAADMFEGWYAQWMSDSLASIMLDDGTGVTDFVGGIQVTKVGYVGEPIFGDTSTQTSASGIGLGAITVWGYVLIFLGLWLLLSICFFFYYVYSNILKENEGETFVEKKSTRNEDGHNNINNNTFTMESEEDEEEAHNKNKHLPTAREVRSNSYDESYARQMPYEYSDGAAPLALPPISSPPPQESSFSRMGILPIDIEKAVMPLQTPQNAREPMAHRRVQSTGNDYYQFTPGGAAAANDPRFMSVTPQEPPRRTYETPTSPPRLSYRDYQPTDAHAPYGASSITESYTGGGGYNNYSLDHAHVTHRLPSYSPQDILHQSLPDWATPRGQTRQEFDDQYHHSHSRRPGTTTTVVDSRGRVRKEIAL